MAKNSNNLLTNFRIGMLLKFTKTAISFRPAVNDHFAYYKVENTELITTGFAITKMGGSRAIEAIDSTTANFLSSHPHIEVS